MPRVRYEGEAVTFGALGRICPQGQGTMRYLDGADAGCRYEGGFLGGNRNGLFHGQGKWYRPDDILEYEGEWQRGLYHGTGTWWEFEGDYAGYRYEGDFVEGQCHGQGKYYRPDNTLEYEGGWQNDAYHGTGTWWEFEGDYAGYRYEGDFVEGQCHGQGKYYRPGCTLEYEGGWQQDNYHGHGRSYFPDGTTIKYEGDWQESVWHGQGTLYNPDGSIRHRGRFADGEPIDDTTPSAGDDSSETDP